MSSSGSVPSSSSPLNSSTESLDGLKFGQKIYFEDVSGVVAQAKQNSGGGSCSSGIKKGGRVSGAVQGTQPPRCQVEGCKVDLSGAKAYYSRHKVCGMHSKSPTVVVAGLEQRFCQQCSRFHQLPEFDQGKRSCRRRLAGHNERRRKPQPNSSLTSRFSRLSSPIFDNSGRGDGFLMEFASYPKLSLRNAVPTPRSSEPVPGNQTALFTWQANSETPSNFFLQGSVGGTNFSGPPRHPPVESYDEVTNSSCALSLLSSQTWGSRNTTPDVELNNLLNFDGSFMTQLAASSQGAAIHQLPNASWCLKGIDSGNCLPDVPDLGLGQNSQPVRSHPPGEFDVSQGRRHYMDLVQSRACESPHWSL